MRAVAEGAYANLELPGDAAPTRHPRAGRGVRHRARLRRDAPAGPLRRRHRRGAGRPSTRSTRNVLDTLRLGAHQLLGMRVPTHAAVDETVGLARKWSTAPAPAGFVNAVMRRISERDADEWVARSSRRASRSRRWRCEHSHPRVDRQGAARGPARPRRAPPPRRSTPTSRPCSTPTTPPPRSRSWPGPAWPPSTSSSTPAPSRSALSPVGAVLGRRRPGRHTGGARRPGGGAGRGLPAASRSRWPRVDVDRRRARALARPVRRPRRQGGAARRPWPSRRVPTSSPTR